LQTAVRLLIASVAVAAVVVSAMVLQGCRRTSSGSAAAASFSFDDVPADSRGLAVEVAGIRGELHTGYIEWACLLTCKNPAGCDADLQLTIHYTSTGTAETITFAGPIDVPMGARARVGGVQRPPRAVDAINSVEIEAKPRHRPGEPAPTPRI
jgi:hypothetical protein